jgi:hypothetical protein
MQVTGNSQSFSLSQNYNIPSATGLGSSSHSQSLQPTIFMFPKGTQPQGQSGVMQLLETYTQKLASVPTFMRDLAVSLGLAKPALPSTPPMVNVDRGLQTMHSSARIAREVLSGVVDKNVSDPTRASQYYNAIDEVTGLFANANRSELENESQGAKSFFMQAADALGSIGINAQTTTNLISTVLAWDQLSSSDRIATAGALGVDFLQGLDVLDAEQANDFKNVAGALSVFFNSQASSRDKIQAGAAALAGLATTSFTGSLDGPQTIGGIPVIGSAITEDGSAGFMLENGTVVPRSDILATQNVNSALQAISILTSKADTKDKVLALTQIGVQAGIANELISNVNAGRIGSALGLINTVSNWDKMNNGQRVAATLQTADTVLSALNGSVASNTAASSAATTSSAGVSSLGAAASGAAAVAGIVMGVDQAADVIDAIGDMPRSEAVKAGAIGLGSAGAAIGAGVAAVGVATGVAAGTTIGTAAFPVVGTLIGAVAGAAIGAVFGLCASGKKPGQMMRDKWRDAMEQGGFAQKMDGSHHVQLADGTLYNIGKDGGHKLQNLDGTQRATFDVDGSNPIAGASIPMAHLFVMATGLDPSNRDHGFWDNTVAQALNAATSNATTLEGVQENFRAMLAKGQVDPRALAMKVEVLRVSNKINDQEYGVYLNHINQLFGTQLVPTEREKAHMAIAERLQSMPALEGGDKELFEVLTNPVKYQESQIKLAERLNPQV